MKIIVMNLILFYYLIINYNNLKMANNSWVMFLKDYYSHEKKRDSSKCRKSLTLRQLSKSYKCKKNLANKTKKNKDKFKGVNPMHKNKK